jgi:hypothetical protein
MAGLPDPLKSEFPPAPPGQLRVVAWRQRTPTWPHPDLPQLHAERAALLHWWANEHDVPIGEWGETDAERPAEFVVLLVSKVVVPVLAAALTGLVKDYVKRRGERRRSVEASEGSPPPEGDPLMALTVVNESGGTVIIYNSTDQSAKERALALVLDPRWQGREEL